MTHSAYQLVFCLPLLHVVVAEIGEKFWMPLVIGDFPDKAEARKFLETQVPAGTVISDDEWTEINEVRAPTINVLFDPDVGLTFVSSHLKSLRCSDMCIIQSDVLPHA